MDLDQYLSGEYINDNSTVEKLQPISEAALRTLMELPVSGGSCPYGLENRKEVCPLPEHPNVATTAMVLHAIAVTIGDIRDSQLVPRVRTRRSLPAEEQQHKILKSRIVELINTFSNGDETDSPLTYSQTFGADYPLTLAWLYELDGIPTDANTGDFHDRLVSTVHRRIRVAFNDPSHYDPKYRESNQRPRNLSAVSHPLPLLTLIQLYEKERKLYEKERKLYEKERRGRAGAWAAQEPRWNFDGKNGIEPLDTGAVQTWLLDQLHRQLSLSSIRDGESDPAVLVFALEGALRLNPEIASQALIDRVNEVLCTTPLAASHWRPVCPLTVTSQGLVLLPQSVEVANSFLRICHLLDGDDYSAEAPFAASLSTLRTYADWIVTRSIRGEAKIDHVPLKYLGWQSEHTFVSDVVHTWATSQVLLFLHSYGAMLERHIAITLRTAANLETTTYPEPDSKEWEKAMECEPWSDGAEPKYRVYNVVNDSFVRPRSPGLHETEKSYSALLYGPPGAGKTYFARRLAEALGYDLLIVTPSDFIRAGEAGVEARSQRLFKVLGKQADVVVLFDEIDRLLLDRDSDKYGSQSDMFQFMTPSMLTKINELRASERVVFLIATNYAERIDVAIKRRGRIDHQLLMLPPDLKQRKRLVRRQEARSRSKDATPWTDDQVSEVALNTPLYAFRELEAITDQMTRDELELGEKFKVRLGELKNEFAPSIRLGSYRSRFFPKKEDVVPTDVGGPEPPAKINLERTPWEEFNLLAYLWVESSERIPEPWMFDVVKRTAQQMEGADITSKLLSACSDEER